ncbi:MAG: PKD domain-containing protein [Candidatus Bipolaricaulia bacterium]
MKLRFPAKLTSVAVLIIAIALTISGCLGQPTSTPRACIQAEPTIGYAPLTVTFDASCSYVPEGAEDVYHFQWEFDDGSEGTGRIAVHTFTEPGTYTVAVIMLGSSNGLDLSNLNIGTRVVTVLPTTD